jgi:hypothetical protein
LDGVVKGNDELWDHLFHGKPLKHEQAEQVPKDHLSKQQASKEQASKEQASKEQASKEQASKEQASKEQASKEQASKELASKDQISKEQIFKDHALTNKVSKDPDEMKRIKSENAKLANQVTEIQTQLISQAIQVNNLSNKLMEAEEELVR